MLTLFDYLPSQNAWKVRQLLSHLHRPYVTKIVSIFEGEGSSAEYRKINPAGAVPAIELDDGRVLAESNAILAYLAEGTPFLPSDAFARAKVHQWLSFEQQYIEMTIGSLRFWTLTGKLPQRSAQMIEGRRNGSLISNSDGEAVQYALFFLQERGTLFVDPGVKVYVGLILGEHSRDNDLDVNPIKEKKLTNIRAAGKDEALLLTPPRRMSLEQAISYIEDDELVEVTPGAIRLRKRYLDPHERKKHARRAESEAA